MLVLIHSRSETLCLMSVITPLLAAMPTLTQYFSHNPPQPTLPLLALKKEKVIDPYSTSLKHPQLPNQHHQFFFFSYFFNTAVFPDWPPPDPLLPPCFSSSPDIFLVVDSVRAGHREMSCACGKKTHLNTGHSVHTYRPVCYTGTE